MLKRIKRLFLVIPMLACLFTVSSINQVNANSVAANVNKTIATSSTPVTIITDNPSTNSDLGNGLNSLPTQIQDQVKPLIIAPNLTETIEFFFLGCSYYISVTKDDEGTIVCQQAATICGTHITLYATGDQTQCSEDED